jgi:hypothetical protein
MRLQPDSRDRADSDGPATYQIYSLCVHSNRPIPGLVPIRDAASVDLEVRLNPDQPWPNASLTLSRSIWHESVHRDEAGKPVLKIWKLGDGTFFHLRYQDDAEFLVDGNGTNVWATWPAALTLADACAYMLGPVLGLVLRLREVTCLHASAIDIGGCAVAIAGGPGTGKSTTAAIFAKSGYRVLADDVVALADRGTAFMAQPSHPRIGLWADSVEILFGSPKALPEQTPTWTKCCWDLAPNELRFQSHPLPLLAVYILGERQTTERAPFVETLSTRTALTQLIENTYVSYLLDRAMSSRDLDVLARVAMSVPVRRVVPHGDFRCLSRLRDAILSDAEGLAARASTTAGSALSTVGGRSGVVR